MTATPGELLALASAIAREAGALLALRAGQVRTNVQSKSTATDMVSEVDHESEALIIERILAARPGDGILGEEGGERAGTSGVRWVVDPLDGTTNFLYGLPAYAVSIAVESDGVVVAGAVFDAAHGQLFSASLGGGAFLDGQLIRVSLEVDLAKALTGTGFGYVAEQRREQGRVVAQVVPQVRDIRRGGSAALDLCSVACGRLDAYYELGLGPWDFAAGGLIVREAGGETLLYSEDGHIRLVVAAPPALMAPLRAALREAGTQGA
ncbi:MAG: inositol monophosphatase family protein [Dehalococcoidia bacterium]